MDTPTYLYRCTEQQLETHLQRIAEEGDGVEHVIFKGGRDYVLVCRKASDQDPVAAALEAILDLLTEWQHAFAPLSASPLDSVEPQVLADAVSRRYRRRGGA